MFKKMLIVTVFIFSFSVFSEDGLTIVSVGQADVETESVYLFFNEGAGLLANDKKLVKELFELLKNDLLFYKNKFSISPNSTGSRYQLELTVVKDNKKLKIAGKLSKEGTGVEEFSGSVNTNSKDLRSFGHDLADKVYKNIIGKPSMFKSKIVFVTDKDGNRANPAKELYIMDFDGRNKRRLTFHGGTVISPAISNDGTKVLYSLIKSGRSKRRNINLRIFNITTGKSRLLSSKRGINSGAIFMPGEESIALTLSHLGNAEIFIMNLKTKKLRRITKHSSPDVDPSISFDGKLMTILSGRAGKAMIYTLDPSGREQAVKRVSFVGKYNATPRFSPDGKEIVFSSWLDTRFDLFRIDANGRNLSRLTKDFGSNEDPTYSPDGEFIGFSSLRVLSQRKADQNIYIMDRDGEILGKITDNFGNCITPRWSKSL